MAAAAIVAQRPELAARVLAHLDDRELASVAGTCRLFASLARERQLPRTLFDPSSRRCRSVRPRWTADGQFAGAYARMPAPRARHSTHARLVRVLDREGMWLMARVTTWGKLGQNAKKAATSLRAHGHAGAARALEEFMARWTTQVRGAFASSVCRAPDAATARAVVLAWFRCHARRLPYAALYCVMLFIGALR